MEAVATAMQDSFKVDPGWAQREAQQVAIRSRIISQTGQEIADMISASFRLRSQTQDRISHAWSHAILGTVDVYDPETGQGWTVPSGSEHYWKRGYEIYGTRTADPPNPDPGYTELSIENW